MACPQVPVLVACVVGASLGGGFYWIASYRKKAYSAIILLEAMSQGFLLAGALHLMYCVACPGQLVELMDKEERIVHIDQFTVKLDSLHGIEIFLASVILIIVCLRALRSIWQKPGH